MTNVLLLGIAYKSDSGFESDADNGTLALYIGGTNQDVKKCMPLISCLAGNDTWYHLGDTGCGHFAKVANNFIVATV